MRPSPRSPVPLSPDNPTPSIPKISGLSPLETNLESLLATAFPQDQIEPVPKGTRGADIIHRVVDTLLKGFGLSPCK